MIDNPLVGLTIQAAFEYGYPDGFGIYGATGNFVACTETREAAEAICQAGKTLDCGHPAVCLGKVHDSDTPHCLWCGDIADLGTVARNASLVYEHVTGGKVSKPLTDADVVNSLADDCTTKTVEFFVADEVQAIKDQVRSVADQIWQGLLDQRQASDALYEISGKAGG